MKKRFTTILSALALVCALVATPAFASHGGQSLAETATMEASADVAGGDPCCADETSEKGEQGDCNATSYFLIPNCHGFALEARSLEGVQVIRQLAGVRPEPLKQPPRV